MNPDDRWTVQDLDALIARLESLQRGLLAVLHALGLAPEVHGQPAWPFARQVALPLLSIDAPHARQVAGVLLLLALALLCWGGAAALWLLARRIAGAGLGAWSRPFSAGLALAGLAAITAANAVWPDAAVLWAPATPTSFHRLPLAAQAGAGAQGAALYRQHCLACHGAQADGDGPLAETLPRFPPTLNRGLLWQRREGELFWHIRHGMADAQGRATMPAAGGLDDAAVWQLIAWLQWQAAGQQLARSGQWQLPVAAPALQVQCQDRPARPLADLKGQRLRIVALAPGQPAPAEDPRFQTVVLSTQPVKNASCTAGSDAAWQAYALVAGVPARALAGTEFLLDRDGWLRARRRAGDPPWSDAMLVCRSGDERPPATARSTAPSAVPADPLDRLLAQLDADPVRPVRGGRVH